MKAVLNLAVREWDIDVSNPLVGTFIPDVGTRKKRVPFTEKEILWWCQTNSNQSQFAGKHANLCGTKKAPLSESGGAVQLEVLS